jgi:hypothetical protein
MPEMSAENSATIFAEEAAKQKARANCSGSPANAVALRQTSSEFVAKFVPPDYLLDGVLQRCFLYSFTGRMGSGKTAVVPLQCTSSHTISTG